MFFGPRQELAAFSAGSRQELAAFSAGSRQELAAFSAGSRQELAAFSAGRGELAARGCPPGAGSATPSRDGSYGADCRSSVEVVCSRILRHARVDSRSAAKCLTTVRTRVAEMSMPCRAQMRLKRG